MSKKISQLPAVVAIAGSDEQETNQGGVSKKWTHDQLVSYLESLNPFLFTSIQVASGASFSGGNIIFDGVGNVEVTTLQADSISSTAGASVWTIGAAGDVTFGGGMELAGGLNVGTGPIQVGGNSSLNGNGSASFAGGGCTIDPLGGATFAGGAASINDAGEIQSPSYYVGPDQGITQDVVIGGTTLHFSGGICIGVD